MKTKKVLIAAIIFVLTLSNIVFALEIPPEQLPFELPGDSIDIDENEDGLKKISYVISSTRLNNNSTTTYQTSEIYVDLGEYTFTVPSSELSKIKPKASEGTVYHMITITKNDIINDLKKKGANDTEINRITEQYLKNPEKIDIRSKIDIKQNGKVVHSMTSLDDLNDAKKYGFNDKHVKDMETRFKESKEDSIRIPTGEDTPTKPKGLRPTILRNKSIRDD